MNIYITLDYELFFGIRSGSAEKCVISPTEALLNIVDPYNIKLNFFVDAGYLLKLKAEKDRFPQLKEDYNKLIIQLKALSLQGHSIELHIHPHWEDSYFDGQEWVFDTSRYKIHDFTKPEVMDITKRYTSILKKITGKAPVAYRAGGWSIQPFEHIKEALSQNEVFIDSTVIPQGFHHSKNQYFDFRKVPRYCTSYKFSNKIDDADETGQFTEIPISSYKVSPLFFWKFAFKKLRKSIYHEAFGDGFAVAKPKREILRMLSQASYSVVSIDGYKASYLKSAYKKYRKNTGKNANFVIIGHPKAFSPYSLEKLAAFLKFTDKDNRFKTF